MYLSGPLAYKDTVSIYSNDLSNNHFTNFTNTVYHLHKYELTNLNSPRKELYDKYKSQFIQSSFTTCDEITMCTIVLIQ